MAGERSQAARLGTVNILQMQCGPCVVNESLNSIRVFVQMTVDEARETCAYSWMKEALEAFVCQFKRAEEVASCRLEVCRSEESRRGC